MANLTETTIYETGIYQLEITDPVEGGSSGVSNLQAKQLANRTNWIKNWIDTVKFLFFLKKGTYAIGDFSGTATKTISFTSIGTSNYMVTGSIVSKSSNPSSDDDVIWLIRNKTATSFQLVLRETDNGEVQNIDFDYVLIPF